MFCWSDVLVQTQVSLFARSRSRLDGGRMLIEDGAGEGEDGTGEGGRSGELAGSWWGGASSSEEEQVDSGRGSGAGC